MDFSISIFRRVCRNTECEKNRRFSVAVLMQLNDWSRVTPLLYCRETSINSAMKNIISVLWDTDIESLCIKHSPTDINASPNQVDQLQDNDFTDRPCTDEIENFSLFLSHNLDNSRFESIGDDMLPLKCTRRGFIPVISRVIFSGWRVSLQTQFYFVSCRFLV